MPGNLVEAVRKLLSELGVEVDQLSDEEIREFVRKAVKAMYEEGKTIEDLLRERNGF